MDEAAHGVFLISISSISGWAKLVCHAILLDWRGDLMFGGLTCVFAECFDDLNLAAVGDRLEQPLWEVAIEWGLGKINAGIQFDGMEKPGIGELTAVVLWTMPTSQNRDRGHPAFVFSGKGWRLRATGYSCGVVCEKLIEEI
jgi:hypothetical protein